MATFLSRGQAGIAAYLANRDSLKTLVLYKKKGDKSWHLRKGYLFTFELLLNIITNVFDITIKNRRNNPFP